MWEKVRRSIGFLKAPLGQSPGVICVIHCSIMLQNTILACMAGLRNRKHARIGISLVCHETICWFEFSLSFGVSEDWESPAEPSLHSHPIRLMLMVWWLGSQRQRALEHTLACRSPGFTDLPSPVWLQWELLITFVQAFPFTLLYVEITANAFRQKYSEFACHEILNKSTLKLYSRV